MADTKIQTDESLKKKRRRRKKKTPQPIVVVPVVTQKNEKILSQQKAAPVETEKKSTGILSDIGDISTYIQKMKKTTPHQRGEGDFGVHKKGFFAADGTNLEELPSVYAIVPHARGNHKLVYMQEDAPDRVRDDDKTRTAGSVYIKGDKKIYDVYVDFKRHPFLKSTQGENLDIWLIQSPESLEKQLEAIHLSEGGGINFGVPHVLVSPIDVVPSSVLIPIVPELVDEREQVEQVIQESEVKIEEEIVPDEMQQQDIYEQKKDIYTPDLAEDAVQSLEVDEQQEVQEVQEIQEEESFTLDADPVSSLAEEIVGEDIGEPYIQEVDNTLQNDIQDIYTPEDENVLDITVPDIDGTTLEDTVSDVYTDIPQVDIPVYPEPDMSLPDVELPSVDVDSKEDISSYIGASETLDEDGSDTVIQENSLVQEDAVIQDTIEATDSALDTQQGNDAFWNTDTNDTIQEEPIAEPQSVREQTEYTGDMIDTTPVLTPEIQEPENIPETQDIYIEPSIASIVSPDVYSETVLEPETTVVGETIPEIPKEISLDISDIALDIPIETDPKPLEGESILDTFKDGVDTVFHTHLHDEPITPLQAGVVSQTSLDQLSTFQSGGNHSNSQISPNKNKKIFVIIGEILLVLTLIGIGFGVYKMMFGAIDISPETSIEQSQEVREPVSSKEQQLKEALQQKSGTEDEDPVPEIAPSPVETEKTIEALPSKEVPIIMLTNDEFQARLQGISTQAMLSQKGAQDNEPALKLLRIITQKVAFTLNKTKTNPDNFSQEEMQEILQRLDIYLEQAKGGME